MKTLAMLLMVTLAGCASRPSLVELEEQALASGDWSAVEAREKSMQRLLRSKRPVCPEETTRICVDNGGTPVCECRASGLTISTIR
jgi:hypothetical protein